MLVSNKPVVEHRSRVKGRLFFLRLGEEKKIYIYRYISLKNERGRIDSL